MARVAFGLAAMMVPIASAGIGWWELAALDVFVLLSAAAARLVVGGYERYAPEASPRATESALLPPAR